MAWGYDHESFWDQTLKTFLLTAKAQAARMREEHNDRQSLAWHTAALYRVKQLPRLNTLQIADPTKPRRRQTMEEQLAAMDQLAARMEKIYGSPMKRTTEHARDSDA